MGEPQLAVVHGGEEIRGLGSGQGAERGFRDLYLSVIIRGESDLKRVERIISGEIGKNTGLAVRVGSRKFRGRRIPQGQSFGNR